MPELFFVSLTLGNVMPDAQHPDQAALAIENWHLCGLQQFAMTIIGKGDPFFIAYQHPLRITFLSYSQKKSANA